jgi:AraC family transcriptional regulator of arabinose operon
MMQIAAAEHTAVLKLLTGHFHETSGYRAFREHGVADWLLIHTVSGLGRFGHAGGELIGEPGDWVLLRPGTAHDYGVEGSLKRWELVWAHFQPRAEWQAWLNWPEVADGLMRLRVDKAEIAARFLDVHRLHTSDLRQRENLAMNALEEVLLRLDEHTMPVVAGDERVRRAMDYLERNLERKVVLDDVADAVGLSTSRLAHLFRAEAGQTPQRYLETRRMQRAAELLVRTSFSIKQIAAAVGFESPFYFSLRFKAWTRQSPTAFREADRR